MRTTNASVYHLLYAVRFTVMFLSLFFFFHSLPFSHSQHWLELCDIFIGVRDTHTHTQNAKPSKIGKSCKKEIHSFVKASLTPLHIMTTQFVEFCYSFAIFTLVSFDTFTASFGYLSFNVVSFSKAII